MQWLNSWHFDFIFLIIKDSPRTGGIIIACSLPQNWRIPPDLGKFCIVKISFLKFSKIFSFILQKINLVSHSSIIKECSWVIMGLQHYFGMRKCTSKKRHFPRSGGFPQNQNFSFPQIWGNFPRSGCSLTDQHKKSGACKGSWMTSWDILQVYLIYRKFMKNKKER